MNRESNDKAQAVRLRRFSRSKSTRPGRSWLGRIFRSIKSEIRASLYTVAQAEGVAGRVMVGKKFLPSKEASN